MGRSGVSHRCKDKLRKWSEGNLSLKKGNAASGEAALKIKQI